MSAINLTQKKSDMPKRSMEEILPSTFFIMKFCGLWKPLNLNYSFKVAYMVYTVFAMFVMVTVGISLVCVVLFSPDKRKEVIMENSFLLLTLLNGWVKAIIILRRRKDIKSLLKVLLKDQCQPSDSVELEIQSKFDKEVRYWFNIGNKVFKFYYIMYREFTLKYSTLVGGAVIIMYLAVFTKKGDERIELLNVWRPYNLKVQLYFWITWIHEVVGHIITASVHVVSDTLIPGLMIQLSCQLKFLRHRLNDFPRRMKDIEKDLNNKIEKRNLEKYFISLTVTHHNVMYRFAKKLRQTFVEVLFIQFSISLFVICFCIFKFTKEDSADYSTILMLSSYTSCMLTELFLFCWYGNELMLHSINLQEAILETNWLSFEEETKKSLIILMIRSRKPILISAGFVMIVNLDSFLSILKASYSAYNVLKDST